MLITFIIQHFFAKTLANFTNILYLCPWTQLVLILVGQIYGERTFTDVIFDILFLLVLYMNKQCESMS